MTAAMLTAIWRELLCAIPHYPIRRGNLIMCLWCGKIRGWASGLREVRK